MKNICEMGQKLNHNIYVITDDHHTEEKKYDQIQNFSIVRVKGIKILRSFLIKKLINQALLKNKFDMIFFDSWKILKIFPYHHVKKNNIKVLIHGNELLKEKNRLKMTQAFLKANLIISNSIFTKNLFNKITSSNSQISKIPIKIVYPAFINQISNQTPKKKYDLITVSRLEFRKGHHLVLEAIKNLKIKKSLKISYLIFGSGPESKNLGLLAKKFAISEQIYFKNEGDIYHHFDQSKVHILPSIHDEKNFSIEGFGISNVEAASRGLPCIVSQSGGLKESVCKNGFVVKEGSISDIEEAIEKILFNDEIYKNFSINSIKWSEEFISNKKFNEYLC